MNCVIRVAVLLSATVSVLSKAEQIEFDTSFLQGVHKTPKALVSLTGIVEGRYLPTLTINGASKGRVELNITKQEEDNDKLCFVPDFLQQHGIVLTQEAKSKLSLSECLDFDNLEFSSVEFDITKPALSLTIPQLYIEEAAKERNYDRGINGAKLNYSLNGSIDSEGYYNAFASLQSQLNIQGWVVHHDMNSAWTKQDELETNISNLYAEYPITSIGADLVIGKGYSNSDFIESFSFGGVGLSSNRLMSNATASFIPDISGVASSNSRITVRQNGRLVHTETVTPGPFKIDGFSIYGSGDLEVEIEDANGHRDTKLYPVSIMPSLLRHGYFEYSLAMGKRFNGSGIDGLFDSNRDFLFANAQYGFESFTFGSSAVLDEKYQGLGLGSTLFLSHWGTLGVNAGMSFADYDNGEQLIGTMLSAKYNNKLTDSTSVQLIANEYKNKDYRSYSTFTPDEWREQRQSPKHRMQAVMSTNFDRFNTSLIGWHQSYWGTNVSSAGMSLSLSATLAETLISTFSLGYTDNHGHDDMNMNLSFSLPLNYNEKYHTLTTRFSGGNNADFAMSTSAGGQLSDNLSYAMSVGDYGVNTNLGYDNDVAQWHGGLNYFDGHSSLSAGVSGSLLWTSPSGLLASRSRNSTIAVVDLNDVSDVKVNGIGTNSKGVAVVGLQAYEDSHLSIDVNTIPWNVSIDTSSHKVSATENAIVYYPVDTRRTYKYTLQVTHRDGKRLTSGEVYFANGVYAGAIAPNSMMTFSADTPAQMMSVNNGLVECAIDLSRVSANQGKVSEVICE